jgi:hypothetical protein
MIAQIVRFRSSMSEEGVVATYQARMLRYRDVPGLVQKYYLYFPETGEHGAVYLWDSRRSMARFQGTDLARTIPDAYQIVITPGIEVADVLMALYPDAETADASV